MLGPQFDLRAFRSLASRIQPDSREGQLDAIIRETGWQRECVLISGYPCALPEQVQRLVKGP